MSFDACSPDATDPRLAALLTWGQNHADLDPLSLSAASADASSRRYFRIRDAAGISRILVDAPTPPENPAAYVRVATLLRDIGLHVPEVFAADLDAGFLLVSDLGEMPYAHALNEATVSPLYLQAIDALIRLQCASRPGVLPEYDRAFLQRELGLFEEWYVPLGCQTRLSPAEHEAYTQVCAALLTSHLSEAQVYVHRDYHSRNLMCLPEGGPGILDFQDALYGPLSYDLVSLLRDAYVQWDEERVLDLVVRYWERARRAGLPVPAEIDQFYRQFEWMGVQRHLKILGIFTRLHHRDGKSHCLGDIPRVLDYLQRTCARYRELMPLARLLDRIRAREAQVGYTF